MTFIIHWAFSFMLIWLAPIFLTWGSPATTGWTWVRWAVVLGFFLACSLTKKINPDPEE